MTPYNQFQNAERAMLAGRNVLADPGSGGTIKVFCTGMGVVHFTTAGTRTLQAATQLGLGTSVLCCCSAATASVVGATTIAMDDGEFVLFQVCVDTSGANAWKVISSSAIAGQTAAKVVSIPQTQWRKGADIAVAITATSTTTAFAIINGTLGTDLPYIRTNPATGSVTQAAVATVTVPEDYQAGTALSLRFKWTSTTPATTSAALDCKVYRAAAPTVDICATDASSCNATGTVDFAMTVTSVVPGECLLVYWEVAIVSGAASTDIRFDDTKMVYTA